MEASQCQTLDALKAHGLYNETIIVLAADHGEMLGLHQLWQRMCNYEEAVRVPLQIRLPQSRCSGEMRDSDELVSHIDVLPTILDYFSRR